MPKRDPLKNMKAMLDRYIARFESYSGVRPKRIALSAKDYDTYFAIEHKVTYAGVVLQRHKEVCMHGRKDNGINDADKKRIL